MPMSEPSPSRGKADSPCQGEMSSEARQRGGGDLAEGQMDEGEALGLHYFTNYTHTKEALSF